MPTASVGMSAVFLAIAGDHDAVWGDRTPIRLLTNGAALLTRGFTPSGTNTTAVLSRGKGLRLIDLGGGN